jgi:hypothetical protein
VKDGLKHIIMRGGFKMKIEWHSVDTPSEKNRHVLLYESQTQTQFIGYFGGDESGWRINAPGFPSMYRLPTHWSPMPNNPI